MAKYLLLALTLFVTACTTSQPIPAHTSLPSIVLADIVGSWKKKGWARLLIFNDDGSYGFASNASYAENPNECHGQIKLNGTMLTFIPDYNTPSGCARKFVYNIELNEEGQLVFSVVEDKCGIAHIMTGKPWNRNSP